MQRLQPDRLRLTLVHLAALVGDVRADVLDRLLKARVPLAWLHHAARDQVVEHQADAAHQVRRALQVSALLAPQRPLDHRRRVVHAPLQLILNLIPPREQILDVVAHAAAEIPGLVELAQALELVRALFVDVAHADLDAVQAHLAADRHVGHVLARHDAGAPAGPRRTHALVCVQASAIRAVGDGRDRRVGYHVHAAARASAIGRLAVVVNHHQAVFGPEKLVAHLIRRVRKVAGKLPLVKVAEVSLHIAGHGRFACAPVADHIDHIAGRKLHVLEHTVQRREVRLRQLRQDQPSRQIAHQQQLRLGSVFARVSTLAHLVVLQLPGQLHAHVVRANRAAVVQVRRLSADLAHARVLVHVPVCGDPLARRADRVEHQLRPVFDRLDVAVKLPEFHRPAHRGEFALARDPGILHDRAVRARRADHIVGAHRAAVVPPDRLLGHRQEAAQLPRRAVLARALRQASALDAVDRAAEVRLVFVPVLRRTAAPVLLKTVRARGLDLRLFLRVELADVARLPHGRLVDHRFQRRADLAAPLALGDQRVGPVRKVAVPGQLRPEVGNAQQLERLHAIAKPAADPLADALAGGVVVRDHHHLVEAVKAFAVLVVPLAQQAVPALVDAAAVHAARRIEADQTQIVHVLFALGDDRAARLSRHGEYVRLMVEQPRVDAAARVPLAVCADALDQKALVNALSVLPELRARLAQHHAPVAGLVLVHAFDLIVPIAHAQRLALFKGLGQPGLFRCLRAPGCRAALARFLLSAHGVAHHLADRKIQRLAHLRARRVADKALHDDLAGLPADVDVQAGLGVAVARADRPEILRPFALVRVHPQPVGPFVDRHGLSTHFLIVMIFPSISARSMARRMRTKLSSSPRWIAMSAPACAIWPMISSSGTSAYTALTIVARPPGLSALRNVARIGMFILFLPFPPDLDVQIVRLAQAQHRAPHGRRAAAAADLDDDLLADLVHRAAHALQLPAAPAILDLNRPRHAAQSSCLPRPRIPRGSRRA